jgi:hypothetical protein
LSFIGRFVAKLRGDAIWNAKLAALEAATTQTHLLLGRIHSERVRQIGSIDSLAQVEFSISSQFGDDGIIQWLTGRLDLPSHTFIEFGVEDYKIANTRFLLMNDHWSGLVMDGSPESVAAIKDDEVSFRYDLKAACVWVTAEDINTSIEANGINGEIGLLHIDIDGNDYWVWRAIDVVRPAIVIMEYNSVFGPDRTITVPYDPMFIRSEAHPSRLYCGASISALCDLAEAKGYDFIGSNADGNNAYFVSKALNHGLRALTPQEGYVESKFAEYRDEQGEYVRGDGRIEVIRGLPVFNTRTNVIEPL